MRLASVARSLSVEIGQPAPDFTLPGVQLHEKRDYTLEELGEMFTVTRERIRQIEQKSLQILRNPNRRRPLPSARVVDTVAV